jgi:hypothetical protein
MSTPTNVEKTTQHLQYLEQSLLSPSVRRDRDRVAALLADDFVEFGSSGKIWTREQILEMLGKEESDDPAPSVEDLKCKFLSDSVVLITYKTVRTNAETQKSFGTLRSSLWSMKSGTWQVHFHQGTSAR